MRRRTITLVVVGLVMALFVLPAAAQIVLDTEPEAEEAVEEAMYELDYGYDADSHVVLYGLFERPAEGEEPVECLPEDSDLIIEVDPDTGEVTVGGDLPEGCEAVNIEGPNGQVNHGQFVSNMVHALKAEYDKDMHGPFGQWVKQFAHDDEIGKGDLQVKVNDDDDDDDGDDVDAVDDQKKDKPEKSNNGRGKGPNK